VDDLDSDWAILLGADGSEVDVWDVGDLVGGEGF
jgi:hypothetical protein